MSDDHAKKAVSSYNKTLIETPNIDRLAREGIRKILPGQGYYYNPIFIEQGDTINSEGYVTDLITDYALETLSKRNRDQPFCLLVHHKAPHRNWMPDTDHLDLFKDKNLPEPDNLFDDYQTRSAAARD